MYRKKKPFTLLHKNKSIQFIYFRVSSLSIKNKSSYLARFCFLKQMYLLQVFPSIFTGKPPKYVIGFFCSFAGST